MNIHYLADLAASSGGTLYLMAVLLLVALAVIIERAWFLYRVMAGGRHVNERIASLPRLRADLLEKEVASAGHLPHAALLAMTLSHPELNERDLLADRLEESILHEVPKLDRSMWVLDTAVTLAPLLGLFGTIIGMFNAFAGLGQGGSGPTQITGGVAEALIATASGLFIAMIGLIFLNSLNTRIRLLVHQLETLKQMLINRYAQQSGELNDVHHESRPVVLARAKG
ncbi:MAG: MotA/TolQ/ExbB proton channel family protein [Betaproteobacteria bacterium]|nr:MotA/TolQ/ExbB proton channel family protein [Betaproteobacteria bacterium]